MKVLVSGISGYLGKALAAQLLEEGHQVYGLSRKPSPIPQVPCFDPSGPESDFFTWVRGVAPELAFHLAADFKVEHDFRDLKNFTESNFYLGLKLGQALALASPGARMVVTGSHWQCAFSKAFRPVNLYASLKQAQEDALEYFCTNRSLKICHLRLYDSYGPGDTRARLVNFLVEAAKAKRSLELSAGEQWIYLVHVEDVVSALRHAGQLLVSHSTDVSLKYSIPVKEPIRVKDLGLMVKALSGDSFSIEFGKKPYRNIEMFEPWNAGEPLPGWQPRVTLAEGLKEMLHG